MNQIVRTTVKKRELGAKIAAIEGLSLTPELALLFEKFDSENIEPSERIRLIHQYFDNAHIK